MLVEMFLTSSRDSLFRLVGRAKVNRESTLCSTKLLQICQTQACAVVKQPVCKFNFIPLC